MITTIELRENFINYFRKKEHKLMKPSKSFTEDPTLFFTTAGMVQLKPYILGTKEILENNTQLVNSQICIRCGGKHNDLDDVGFDTYHLTSFDMLGSWSLNSYWKTDAIKLAFEYLISLGLDKNRMYATYFEGNDIIPEDSESYNIWKMYLDESHIIKGSLKDNFWSLGGGPCGPCTEIHYDLEQNRSNVAHLVNKNDPSVIELWNIVLMEFNEVINNDIPSYEPLSKRFVDTGMGLQRLAMVLQNKISVYDTDFYAKLIKYIEILSNINYKNSFDNNDSGSDRAIRIFADHMRTLSIALFDGAVFDIHGRGNVLRKVIKRLLMHYYIFLNNFKVIPIMSHHIIEPLISEILLFHGFKQHDASHIKKLLITEEALYINKIYTLKLSYNQLTKKKSQETILHNFIQNIEQIKAKYGIDMDIVQNIHLISFK